MTKREELNLMNSFRFRLVYWLMDEYMMTRKEAFAKAGLTTEILKVLGEGIVEFSFKKDDGSARKARGTLCKGISEVFDDYEYKTDRQEATDIKDMFTYFDLDRQAFRTFKASRVLDIRTK